MRVAPNRQPTDRAIPSGKQLGAMADALQKKHGLQSCFVGLKCVSGRQTRTISLVCVVKEKVTTMGRADPARIRRQFVYEWGGRRLQIPTDVVEASGPFQFEAEFNPGDEIHHAGGARA